VKKKEKKKAEHHVIVAVAALIALGVWTHRPDLAIGGEWALPMLAAIIGRMRAEIADAIRV
jgi:hypothetical protein